MLSLDKPKAIKIAGLIALYSVHMRVYYTLTVRPRANGAIAIYYVIIILLLLLLLLQYYYYVIIIIIIIIISLIILLITITTTMITIIIIITLIIIIIYNNNNNNNNNIKIDNIKASSGEYNLNTICNVTFLIYQV